MHDPLRAIHDLVFHPLQPTQILLLNTTALGLLWQQAQCRVSELTAVFVQSVCSLPAKKEKKAMVESFHATAVLLCNQLNDYANRIETFPLQEENQQELSTAYRQLRDQLYESLRMLQQFPTLANPDQALPVHVTEAARHWACDAIQQISKEWPRKTDPELLRALLEPLQDLVNHETDSILTVRSLAYLTRLVQQSSKLAKCKPADADTALLFLLIRLNHNSDALLHYACHKLRPNGLDEGTTAYLLQYRRSLLLVQQLQPMPGLALYPELAGCQSTLCHLLQEEIGLHERHPENNVTTTAARSQTIADNRPMFKSCLTMSQLAVMLRWCSQTGILRTETIEELFKAAARSVVTAGKGRFKASSLQTEYYDLDPTAISGAKDFVIQLLNEAKKYPR